MKALKVENRKVLWFFILICIVFIYFFANATEGMKYAFEHYQTILQCEKNQWCKIETYNYFHELKGEFKFSKIERSYIQKGMLKESRTRNPFGLVKQVENFCLEGSQIFTKGKKTIFDEMVVCDITNKSFIKNIKKAGLLDVSEHSAYKFNNNFKIEGNNLYVFPFEIFKFILFILVSAILLCEAFIFWTSTALKTQKPTCILAVVNGVCFYSFVTYMWYILGEYEGEMGSIINAIICLEITCFALIVFLYSKYNNGENFKNELKNNAYVKILAKSLWAGFLPFFAVIYSIFGGGLFGFNCGPLPCEFVVLPLGVIVFGVYFIYTIIVMAVFAIVAKKVLPKNI